MRYWEKVRITYTLDIAFQFKFHVIEPGSCPANVERLRKHLSTPKPYLNDRKWMHAKYISFIFTLDLTEFVSFGSHQP